MGLGTEIPLLLGLGFVVLGPKRMHAMLGRVARAKAELDKMGRGLSLISQQQRAKARRRSVKVMARARRISCS